MSSLTASSKYIHCSQMDEEYEKYKHIIEELNNTSDFPINFNYVPQTIYNCGRFRANVQGYLVIVQGNIYISSPDNVLSKIVYCSISHTKFNDCFKILKGLETLNISKDVGIVINDNQILVSLNNKKFGTYQYQLQNNYDGTDVFDFDKFLEFIGSL